MKFGLTNLFKKKSDAPKPSLDDVDLHLDDIPGAVEIIDGFPRIQWSKVREAVKPYSEHPGIDQIWTELAAQWLGVIRRHVGEGYQIYESKHLLLLSSQPPIAARSMLEVGDGAYERLERLLERKPDARPLGKHVVLVWEADKVYYDYMSHFYAESDREYGMSSGVHLSHGYYHTAINGRYSTKLRTLVHELAHHIVADRPLPRWLNEGLAQFVEDMVPGYRPPLIDARQVRLQQRYWSWFGIDHFWDGDSFLSRSSQHLSYQLADIIFRNLATDRSHGRRLGMFLGSANRDDAGQSACEECFGCSLSDLVEEFLGSGDWGPTLEEPEPKIAEPQNRGD